MEFPNIYKQGDYRLLLILPIILLLVSLYFIPQIQMGVDFKGGILISVTLDEMMDGNALQTNLRDSGIEADVRVFDTAVGPKAEIEVPQSENLVKADGIKDEFNSLVDEVAMLEVMSLQNASAVSEYDEKRAELNGLANEMFDLGGVNTRAEMIDNVNGLQKEFSLAYHAVYSNFEDSITSRIDKLVTYNSISIETVSPRLSEHFISKAIEVIGISALLSIVFVFIFFRSIPPSVAVLIGALSDIVIALGAMGLFGIPFTLPSFAALLMLIGYSLDTDIMLTTRMLKRKGNAREKAYDSMKTGITMTGTAIVAFSVIFILATLTHIPTYFEISAVALAGLVGDLFATWGINAVLLMWYLEKKG